MKKFASFAISGALAAVAVLPSAAFAANEPEAAATDAQPAAPAVEVSTGKMLYSANGNRIAPVYRVTPAGEPQVIIDGHLLTVPTATLSEVNGKLTTSLTKREIVRGS